MRLRCGLLVIGLTLVSSLSWAQEQPASEGSGEGEWSAYAVPTMAETPDEDGFFVYAETPTYDADNVANVYPGPTSPEAAAVHYFASRVRGDERYLEVLPPEDQRSRRLNRGLEEHSEWTFTSFRLVSRKEYEPEDVTLIKVYFEIRYGENRTDSGEDEIALQQVDGRWVVVSVPT